MARSKIALDALQAILPNAKRVDLGDLTRPVTAARKEALKSMLPKVENLDDWGWKGGKEGEITGNQWLAMLQDADDAAVETAAKERGALDEFGDVAEDFWDSEWATARYNDLLGDAEYELADQVGKQLTSVLGNRPGFLQVRDAMSTFADMENANIPRRYTGKIYKGVRERIKSGIDGELKRVFTPSGTFSFTEDTFDAQALANILEPMTHSERMEFLALYPEWVESLEDLVAAVRTL